MIWIALLKLHMEPPYIKLKKTTRARSAYCLSDTPMATSCGLRIAIIRAPSPVSLKTESSPTQFKNFSCLNYFLKKGTNLRVGVKRLMNYSMFVDELLSQSIVTFILKVWGVTPGSVGKQNSQITVNQSWEELRWSCFHVNDTCKHTLCATDIWNLV